MNNIKNAEQAVAKRQQAYKRAFKNNPEALADLAQFCRANESCFHSDPRIHAMLEGRREVYLRIMKYLGTSLDELIQQRVQIANQLKQEK